MDDARPILHLAGASLLLAVCFFLPKGPAIVVGALAVLWMIGAVARKKPR
jgi:hypothetical protein